MTHMCSIRCKFGSPGSGFSSRPAHSRSRSARRALDRTAPCAAAPAGTGTRQPACTVRCGAQRRRTRTPGTESTSRRPGCARRAAARIPALASTGLPAPCAAAPAGTGCSSHARLAAARIPALARQACLRRARRRPRALAQDRPACTVRGGARRRRARTRHREHLTPARLRAGSSRHRIRSPAPHKSPAEQKVAGTAEGRPHRTRSIRSPAPHKSPAPQGRRHRTSRRHRTRSNTRATENNSWHPCANLNDEH